MERNPWWVYWIRSVRNQPLQLRSRGRKTCSRCGSISLRNAFCGTRSCALSSLCLRFCSTNGYVLLSWMLWHKRQWMLPSIEMNNQKFLGIPIIKSSTPPKQLFANSSHIQIWVSNFVSTKALSFGKLLVHLFNLEMITFHWCFLSYDHMLFPQLIGSSRFRWRRALPSTHTIGQPGEISQEIGQFVWH